jgi:riboflavin biosynthesis pyrimidine reductase
VTPFDRFCVEKEELARHAIISGFRTIEDRSAGKSLGRVGNRWTRELFDGDFYRVPEGRQPRPVISLVFVQSRSGNTVADNPSTLGGGETDKHLIYEGLSRVDADAVLAGSATARGRRMVFSVWHPELVALRQALGRARHPAQVIVTNNASLPLDRAMVFVEPALRVFIVTRSAAVSELRMQVRERPWIEVLDAGDPVSLASGVDQLRDRGVRTISAIGGRRTATALLRERLVSELYLTTSSIEAGEPNTPFYEGPTLALTRVVEKAGRGAEASVRFEHLLVG